MTTLVRESESSIEDAAETALRTSGQAVRGQSWIRVADIPANLGAAAQIDRWQVQIEVAFRVEEGAYES